MPIFKCTKCGCIENTALSGYWYKGSKPELCSECDPRTGRWHGAFEKRPATGMKLGNDGFLYSQADIDAGNLAWRIKHQGFKIVGDA